jgi:predicted nucleotidyltransferase
MAKCYHQHIMANIQLPVDKIQAACEQNLVARLELFGSAATDRFNTAASDFDFLVTFKPMRLDQRADTFFGILFALEDLLARKVDLVEKEAIRNLISLNAYGNPHAGLSMNHEQRKLLLDALNAANAAIGFYCRQNH